MRADVRFSWDTDITFFESQTIDKQKEDAAKPEKVPCTWTYEKEHQESRFPQYIHQAKCDHDKCTGYNDQECFCDLVYYSMPVLERQSCDPLTGQQYWNITYIEVATACAPFFDN